MMERAPAEFGQASYRCDVLVAGGGIAGIAAALSAARSGADVILLEKQCYLGGLATAGLISVYLPLCDGRGHQVSFGIAEELLRLSIGFGAQRKYPDAWLDANSHASRLVQRFEVQFNPMTLALLAEELLRKEKVRILYDAFIHEAHCVDRKIEHIDFSSEGSRYEAKASSYVDCTGGAILFAMAGAKTRRYGKGNLLASWNTTAAKGGLHLNMLGTVEKSGFLDPGRHADKPLSKSRYNDFDPDEVSRFLLDSHAALLDEQRRIDRDGIVQELAAIPSLPELRMTRCIVGDRTISIDDYGKHADDSIGMIADWRRRGYVYEIPYHALVGAGCSNLIAAGRDISADDEMWDVSRAIPACAVTGEAAGTAAALSEDLDRIDMSRLQKELQRKGQRLFLGDLEE